MPFNGLSAGDLILVVGGGVGGAFLGVLLATLMGRGAVVVGLLGLVLGAAGLPFALNLATALPKFGPVAAGGDAGAAQPLVDVLKADYPREYGELMSAKSRQFGGGAWRVEQIGRDLMRRQAPLADDENMMGLLKVVRDETAAARTASPKVCAAALEGGSLPTNNRSEADRAEEFQVLARLLDQTATHPYAAHREVDLYSARNRLMTAAVAQIPSEERRLVTDTPNRRLALQSGDARMEQAYCDLSVAVFDELLNRSPHESASVMRALMQRGG